MRFVHVHPVSHWRIRRLFVEGLASADYRSLLSELSGCADCARFFRQRYLAEAALCGWPAGATPFALERVEGAIFDRLSQQVAPQGAAPSAPVPAFGWRWAGAMLAVLMCTLTLLWVARPDGSARRSTSALSPVSQGEPVALAARGEAAGAGSEVGIRLLRVSAKGQPAVEAQALTLGDTVTFTVTNVRASLRHFALVGIQEGGSLSWFYPEQADAGAVALAPDVVDLPLGDGFRLSAHHTPGWLRVTGIFSSEPIDPLAVEDAVRELARHPGALSGLEPLPLVLPRAGAELLQHSIRVEVQPNP